MRSDTAKAAVYAAIAGPAQLGALAFAPGFYPDWYFVLVAVAYGLLLPVLAVLHVRHASVRQSGSVLATSAGTAAIAIGIATSANQELVVAALFVQGVWWWTIGKLWAETGVLPRLFGSATMALAVIAIGAALAGAPLGVASATLWSSERIVLGVWTIALGAVLWRQSSSGG